MLVNMTNITDAAHPLHVVQFDTGSGTQADQAEFTLSAVRGKAGADACLKSRARVRYYSGVTAKLQQASYPSYPSHPSHPPCIRCVGICDAIFDDSDNLDLMYRMTQCDAIQCFTHAP